MTFDQIFAAYYTMYRAEAVIPPSTDDEYKIAMRLANEAVNAWQSYDNTLWQELYQTLVAEGDGDLTVVTGQTAYAAPQNFTAAGGDVKVLNADGTRNTSYPIIPAEEVQFMGDLTKYAYFTGNANTGFTLHLNPAPTSLLNGLQLNYVYYKSPTLFTRGSDVTEMSDPYFIVNRVLANRLRSSRNPYYGSAKDEAEDSLRKMQLKNNSGTWSNPWTVRDHAGTQWGR